MKSSHIVTGVYVASGVGAAEGESEAVGEVELSLGQGIYLMPEEIHSVHAKGGSTMLSMHVYGLSMPRQTERCDKRQWVSGVWPAARTQSLGVGVGCRAAALAGLMAVRAPEFSARCRWPGHMPPPDEKGDVFLKLPVNKL